jgi:hypothetical protein
LLLRELQFDNGSVEGGLEGPGQLLHPYLKINLIPIVLALYTILVKQVLLEYLTPQIGPTYWDPLREDETYFASG